MEVLSLYTKASIPPGAADEVRTPSIDTFRERLKPGLGAAYLSGYTAALEPTDDAYRIGNNKAGDWATDHSAQMVRNIEETTRHQIRQYIAVSYANLDMTDRQLVDGIRRAGPFSQARAQLIARTETGMASNTGSIDGYSDGGVTQVLVVDGDQSDGACADADGQTWTLEYARAHPLEHPNCTRSFDPIFAEATAAPPVVAPEPVTPVRVKPSRPVKPKTEAVPEPVKPKMLEQDIVPPHIESIDEIRAARPTIKMQDPARQRGGRASGDIWTESEYREKVAIESHERMIGEKMTDAEKAEWRAQDEDAMRQMLDTAEPHMRVPERVLEKVLKDTRFKSQFETQSSRGTFDPTFRAEAEQNLFGYNDVMPADQRPVYGYWGQPIRNGSTFGTHYQSSQYGEVIVRFKPEVRARATFTGNDSLGQGYAPEAVDSPSWMSGPGTKKYMFDANGKPIKGADAASKGMNEWAMDHMYIEAQYHGGLRVSDVAEVLMPNQTTGTAAIDPVQRAVNEKALRAAGFDNVGRVETAGHYGQTHAYDVWVKG